MILWKIYYTEIEACDSYDQVWFSQVPSVRALSIKGWMYQAIGFGFGFTTICDWLTSLIEKKLILFDLILLLQHSTWNRLTANKYVVSGAPVMKPVTWFFSSRAIFRLDSFTL